MGLLSFKEWRQNKPSPKKKRRKKSSKKRLKTKLKKLRIPRSFNGSLDQWVQAADALERSLEKLRDIRARQKIIPKQKANERNKSKVISSR